jgi:hypothetical protein
MSDDKMARVYTLEAIRITLNYKIKKLALLTSSAQRGVWYRRRNKAVQELRELENEGFKMEEYFLVMCAELEEVWIETKEGYEETQFKDLYTIKGSGNKFELDRLNEEGRKLALSKGYNFITKQS